MHCNKEIGTCSKIKLYNYDRMLLLHSLTVIASSQNPVDGEVRAEGNTPRNEERTYCIQVSIKCFLCQRLAILVTTSPTYHIRPCSRQSQLQDRLK
jgi:hypothetical protein